MSMRTLLLAGAAVIVLAVGGTLAFAPWNAPSIAQTSVTQAVVAPPVSVEPPAQVVRAVPTSDGAVKLSFAPVVKAVSPSVVNVYATRIEQQSSSPFANDPFFSRSLGSGVIVQAGGVILTNRHVIEGATDVRIALSDGREFPVDVVIEDAATDLAVLRVRTPGDTVFPAITFANSDTLEVGDLVLAIGNPFGVGQTVTSGIVSALARTGVERSDYEFFIQTDAAINPGNSGGALVDMDGHLVGINTAIYSQSGGSVGIGFAIPANMAHMVADAGISGGEIVRPWFGAKLQAVNADIAASLGMAAPHGTLITEVAPDGPAARAGFASGDVIPSVDDLAVDDPSAFNFRLATRPIGQPIQLGRLRDGATTMVSFTNEAAPPVTSDMEAVITGSSRFAGTSVRQLDAALDDLKGLPYNSKGVIVTAIAAGSPAEQMGLQVDDVILSLNDAPMDSAQVFASTASKRVQTWQIILQRAGKVTRSIVSG
jgi:Do/DeqQ family serine protease